MSPNAAPTHATTERSQAVETSAQTEKLPFPGSEVNSRPSQRESAGFALYSLCELKSGVPKGTHPSSVRRTSCGETGWGSPCHISVAR